MAKPKRRNAELPEGTTDLRIIGGKHRGRKLQYEPFRTEAGAVTRPMKHRVRESIFNLVGTGAAGRHAIDLFAGTGALGLEALSRGAAHATLIEKHVPTARVIEANIRSLGVGGETTLLVTSAFLWGKRDVANLERANPWLVFCSPPYSFFVDRQEDMLALLRAVMTHAPDDSLLVVEADERFDFGQLAAVEVEGQPTEWDVRTYAPAVVGVWHKHQRQSPDIL